MIATEPVVPPASREAAGEALYPSLAAASLTLPCALAETFGRFRRARETVQMESPESAATSWMVTRGALACSTGSALSSP